MPITGTGSWLPTIDEFIAHWAQANAALPPLTPLTLSGGYVAATLATDRAALATQFADVQSKENLRQTAAGDRDVKRTIVRPRILQFGPSVRGLLPGSRYLLSLPRTPNFQDAPGKWRNAMDDMSSLWLTINTNSPAVPGFTPPLTLSGTYTQALFATDATALSTAFTTLTTADQNAQLSRQLRDQLFEPIYQRLKQYRLAVVGRFPAGDPIIDSLPKLTPAAGTTPAAVQLSASWDGGSSMAELVWSASLDPDLDYYSVRYHPGPKYKASEEQTVDSVIAGTETFSTDFGLPASGSVAWFKVYVVTTTGNEKGSNAVKVVRV
jgi:hypothetical protein